MSELLDQPAVVVLAAAAAAICLLLEVALPTVGLAGGTGLALAALAAWGVAEQDETWWPLVGVVAAVVVWGVLIAARKASTGGNVAATALFVGGALGYALATEDVPAAITAVVAGGVLAAAFPRIAAASERLSSAPPAVGMEALVGRQVRVVDWDGGTGRVREEGSLWSATGPADLAADEVVEVVGTRGLLLEVERVGSRHG